MTKNIISTLMARLDSYNGLRATGASVDFQGAFKQVCSELISVMIDKTLKPKEVFLVVFFVIKELKKSYGVAQAAPFVALVAEMWQRAQGPGRCGSDAYVKYKREKDRTCAYVSSPYASSVGVQLTPLSPTGIGRYPVIPYLPPFNDLGGRLYRRHHR